MPLIYTLVKRKDMSKDVASGATLYHAQTSITKTDAEQDLYPYRKHLYRQPR